MKTKNTPFHQKILDRILLRICVERFLWPPFWPTPWNKHPRKITAGAIRRMRHLRICERYEELFYRISFARTKVRLQEWGALPPNPIGVETSIGEKRFRHLWTKYKILLDFAHILTKEAQITLQREVGTPPFPATQQEID